MAFITLDDLRDSKGPLMGLDPGTKTLGLAISDGTRLIASPLVTIKRTKFGKNAAELLELYKKNEASALIVGWPVNMDGSEGPRAQSVRDFCLNLLRVEDIPIFLWDERMSTQAVTRGMLDADMSRKRRAEEVDRLAAAYILQGVVDRLRA
jgi:putative Holliday junction resolvase